jgi:hypothetical protein
MSWLLRAVEGKDGRWACRQEWLEPDIYDNLADAVTHIRAVARALDATELLVNWHNGDVERLIVIGSPDHSARRSLTERMAVLVPPYPDPPARSISTTQCKIDATMARLRAERANQ